MKRQRHILRITAALTLLLLSTAIRGNMFSASTLVGGEQGMSLSIYSHSHQSVSLQSSDTFNMICGDDNSDDDVHDDAYLLSGKVKKESILFKERCFNRRFKSHRSICFFSSDNSPPTV